MGLGKLLLADALPAPALGAVGRDVRKEAEVEGDAVLSTGLHEFLDGLQVKMNSIDECILEDFFAQRHLGSAASA